MQGWREFFLVIFLLMEKCEEKKSILPWEIMLYLIKSKFHCAPSQFLNVISVTCTFNYKGENGISSLMLWKGTVTYLPNGKVEIINLVN